MYYPSYYILPNNKWKLTIILDSINNLFEINFIILIIINFIKFLKIKYNLLLELLSKKVKINYIF